NRSPLPSAESFWEAIRQSATARVVLPDSEQDLERAALRFLQRLTAEQWVELDKELHERVLEPRGGLHGACTNGGDLTRTRTLPPMEEAINLLGVHLPIMDVAQILCSEAEFGVPVAGQATPPAGENHVVPLAKGYLERARPLISQHNSAHQQTFLLIPASLAGKALGEALRAALPDLSVVRVPGQSDLMFCREQGCLTVQDLQRLVGMCRSAYENAAGTPASSPHARFDIMDWLPLDP